MTFQEQYPRWEENNISPRQTEIEETKRVVQKWVQSLLWIYKLDFDIHRDIFDKDILGILLSGKYFLNNFEENGYWVIQTKNPDMGVWYALVTQQYFDIRGEKQWIQLFEQSKAIGRTYYRDRQWIKRETSIYFVWSISEEKIQKITNWIKKPISWAFSSEDIKEACKKLEEV